MPYIKAQGWSSHLTFGICSLPCTHNSSECHWVNCISTNKWGVKAACPGSDLLRDWKWSENCVTLCWVNNFNWWDLMAGSDSWGWVPALSHESQFLTLLKALTMYQLVVDTQLTWQHQLCPGWAVAALEASLTPTKTNSGLWRQNPWPTWLLPKSQHLKGCQPNP